MKSTEYFHLFFWFIAVGFLIFNVEYMMVYGFAPYNGMMAVVASLIILYISKRILYVR